MSDIKSDLERLLRKIDDLPSIKGHDATLKSHHDTLVEHGRRIFELEKKLAMGPPFTEAEETQEDRRFELWWSSIKSSIKLTEPTKSLTKAAWMASANWIRFQ